MASPPRVALVSMPFHSQFRPSIQLGLLKAIAGAHGFPAETFHLNLEFADLIGAGAYEAIGDVGRSFLGDWLFAAAAFPGPAPGPGAPVPADEPFLRAALPDVAHPLEFLRSVREEQVPRFLDRLMAEIPWGGFDVVGFTSTFQQNLASFALAARIKAAHPAVVTLFGGANFEGEMGVELTGAIGCVDYAVIGEGDEAFPEFLRALATGADPAAVPGVVCRRDGGVTAVGHRPPFTRLDELPMPDYTEYFDRAERLGLLTRAPRRDVAIPFESSRGCWWGAKHHCTFCGLNGTGMAFRSKSPGRVRQELAQAARRYRSFRFEAVDNILDMAYLRTLLAELVAAGTDYEIFYELKSNLTRDQLRLLRQAGVSRVQPGIESLSTPVLRLMRKGVTGIQNVNTLRWARYYGIKVHWNLLFGFPGERAADYERQEALLPLLAHLSPPGAPTRIWMERFSPIFADPAAFPARYRRPHRGYGQIYPESVDLERIAYFFEYEFDGSVPEETMDGTRRVVRAWRDAWRAPERPTLTFRHAEGFLQIEDARTPAEAGTFTFDGPLAAIYLSCADRPVTAAAMHGRLDPGPSRDEVTGALAEFCDRGLMMRDGDQFLALALPATAGR
ncbi:RiPP maturation radical SAM C-methyltransferase [Amorphoplanes nipponensis]|uniref:RiPP maturation radical SAM protein 1 n=1 Tax=Actinoplanes nipponensis TaxID=135950 RepID=A0A919JQH2_9ACTN|nr:RiPP maturation radical SAM C-methyltransferase [Actinoplanes nipponensis]GIE53918.1 RiPP maturation radical SAM protein 1 [Actinoplanes nipponensis]